MMAFLQRIYNAVKNIQSITTDEIWGSTHTRATKIDNLNATISSRQPNVGLTSTHVGRLDAAISTRATPADCPNPAYYTNARATKLDNLNATISSRADGAHYTSARAAKLDYLDATISSRASVNTCVASETLRVSNDTQRVSSDTSMTKIKEIMSTRTGSMRVRFTLQIASCGGYCYGRPSGQIYVNGIPVGKTHTLTSSGAQTFTDDIAVKQGDLIQLYVKGSNGDLNSTYVRNFRLYFNDTDSAGVVTMS